MVTFDAADAPVRIKERKIHEKGKPWECFYDVPYWSAKHHAMGSSTTMPSRIIAEAKNRRDHHE